MQFGGNLAASPITAPVQDGPTPGPSAAPCAPIHFLASPASKPSPPTSPTIPALVAHPPPPVATVAGPSREGSTAKRRYNPRACNYISASGVRCRDTPARNFHRHWIEKHALVELTMVQRDQLEMRDAKIVKSSRCMELLERHLYECPFHCKDRGNSRLQTFRRKDHLCRHLRFTCKEAHTKEEAWQLANEAVRVTGWQKTFEELEREATIVHCSVEDV
jgi:hypothetical protein